MAKLCMAVIVPTTENVDEYAPKDPSAIVSPVALIVDADGIAWYCSNGEL